MEDLDLFVDLVISNEKGWDLHVESLWKEKAYLTINHFENEAFYHLNKDQAKQIVEHLTKVFEL